MTIHKLCKPGEQLSQVNLPLFSTHVCAGFPSPADDFIDRFLDLNEHLIKHPNATFFARAEGNSLQDIGIFDGDILIVDRALERNHGAIVIAALDGELTCKILDLHRQQLLSANPDFPPINIAGIEHLVIEGVVSFSIRKHLSA